MFTLESGKCLCRQLVPSTKTLITPSPHRQQGQVQDSGGRRWGGHRMGPGTRCGGGTHLRVDGSLRPPPLPCPFLVPAEGPSPVTWEFRDCLLGAICPPPEPQVWPSANPNPSHLREPFCAESDTKCSHSFRGMSRGYCEGRGVMVSDATGHPVPPGWALLAESPGEA